MIFNNSEKKDTQVGLNWFYEKNELRWTPSAKDGIAFETELRYRREGARFITKVGSKMGLHCYTMATGVVYFHRFYMMHSFKQFPRFVTACCCLFLAGKVEETPKKCKDIIKNAMPFLTDLQFNSFGDDPKEEVLTMERILLQTINFDLQVDHPYGHLLKYAKCLKGDMNKIEKMVQMAWTFINDSLCTTICLQLEPEIIAIALMFLAGKLSKFEVTDWVGKTPKQTKWWEMFVEDISVEILEDICHQVLDLYSMPIPETPQDSPPSSPSGSSQPATPLQGHIQPSQSSPSILNAQQPPINTQSFQPQPAAIPSGAPVYRYPPATQVTLPPQAQKQSLGPQQPQPPPPMPPVPPSLPTAAWDPSYQQYYPNYRMYGYPGGPQNVPPPPPPQPPPPPIPPYGQNANFMVPGGAPNRPPMPGGNMQGPPQHGPPQPHMPMNPMMNPMGPMPGHPPMPGQMPPQMRMPMMSPMPRKLMKPNNI